MCMNIDDIAICFFKVLKPRSIPTKNSLKKILGEGKRLINNGWTVQQITDRIVEADMYTKHSDDMYHSLFDIPSFKEKEEPPFNKDNNLLEDKFYYHHRLHSIPEPNEIKIDTEGKIHKKSQPFYLEIIEYFDLDNLTKYFHKKMNIDDKVKYRDNKYTLKYLNNNYGLDLLLFSIDEAYNYLKDKNYRMYSNAKRILNHTEDAYERINMIKETGSNKVKPYYRAYLKQRGDM